MSVTRAHRPASPPLPLPRCKAHRGFTVIELMVTVAILAVLATLAAPSFTALTERWRVRQATEELQSTLYFARSEAIKRGGGVTLTAINSDWAQGWTVADGAGNALQSAGPQQRTAIALKVSSSAKTSITFDRWGMATLTGAATAVALDILLKPTGKNDNDASAIRLCSSQGGRLEQKKGGGACPT